MRTHAPRRNGEPVSARPVLWHVPRTSPHRPFTVAPAGLAGSLLVLLAAALCVRLGFWQLDRREQRASHNARLEARLTQPTLTLDSPIRDTTGMTYRRVQLSGTPDHERTIVFPGKSLRGAPGVHVLTPVHVQGAGDVLVNRGWVPAADAATVDLAAIERPEHIDATGIILPFPGPNGSADVAPADTFRVVWFAIDATALRAQFPYDLMPVEIRLLPDEAAPEFPVRLDPPALDPGPHLGYAIQWFSFAVIAILGWIALVRKERRRALAAAPIVVLAFASPAAGQLRPLDPIDWHRLVSGDAFHAGIGAGLILDQEAALAGTRGTLYELGNFVLAWKTGRALVEVSGTLHRRFEDDEVIEPPAPGVDPPDGSTRRDAGDIRAETTLSLIGTDASQLALRFGTRLPTTSDEPGLDRDRTDFYALLGGMHRIGRIAFAGEAGVGILSTRGTSLAQSDVVVFAVGAELDAGPVTPTLWLVGQDDLHARRVRANEDLSELRLGVRTGGRLWLEGAVLRGIADFSPSFGFLVMAGTSF